jgi:hypothetical protein
MPELEAPAEGQHMNRIRQISLAAAIIGAVLATTPPAYANGSVGQVLIANIQVVTTSSTSVAILNFVGGVGGTRPACALFPNLGMGIDVNTAKGKAVLSTATAAFLAGKKVSVSGTGGCFGTTNSTEIIDFITVYP